MAATSAALNVRPLSRLFKALGDPTRLRIVALLSHGDLCVCHIEAALDLPQPNVSRHLAVLRGAEVVETERKGTWVYYRLAKQADADCRRLLRTLSATFMERDQLRRDVARLLEVKGPSSCR